MTFLSLLLKKKVAIFGKNEYFSTAWLRERNSLESFKAKTLPLNN